MPGSTRSSTRSTTKRGWGQSLKYFRSHDQLPLWLFHCHHDCDNHYDQVVEIISKYEPDETNVKEKQLSKVTPIAVIVVTVIVVVIVVILVILVVVIVVVVFVILVVVANFAF